LSKVEVVVVVVVVVVVFLHVRTTWRTFCSMFSGDDDIPMLAPE
jgi:hypothetical protein